MNEETPKKRFLPPGCWGPIMIFWGAVLAFGGGIFAMFTAFFSSKNTKGLENIGQSDLDLGIWDDVAGWGVGLIVLGIGLAFVQILLWLVHKAMPSKSNLD